MVLESTIEHYTKRCLLRLQKGVSKGLKKHLLQAKRASLRSQKTTSHSLSAWKKLTRLQVNECTGRQVNELLVREDKVTDEQVFSGWVNEWTSEQVTCKRRQGNRWTGV